MAHHGDGRDDVGGGRGGVLLHPPVALGIQAATGDAAAGQKAFVELQCTNCHTMAGVAALPAPTTATPVALGGKTPLPPTDGDLTTDIILPSSHFASGYPAEQTQEGAKSKMPDYTQRMTVRQLADLVAFVQAHYGRA